MDHTFVCNLCLKTVLQKINQERAQYLEKAVILVILSGYRAGSDLENSEALQMCRI